MIRSSRSILNKIFLLISFIMAAEKEDSWVVKHLKSTDDNKGAIFDSQTSKDFITNSEGTSAFSPICCEFNILVQASHGEYKQENQSVALAYLKMLYKKCSELEKDKFRVANCAYIPECFRLLLSVGKQEEYQTTIYNPEDARNMMKVHETWVNEASSGLLVSSINESDFIRESRIYASLVYFQDSWQNSFDDVGEQSFWVEDFEIVNRPFMRKKGYFKYTSVNVHAVHFNIVAVPYVSESNTSRYMIYLVPKYSRTPLDLLWQKFNYLTDDNISKLLEGMRETKLTLQIPKIENLVSNLDLKDILKSTYADQLPDNVTSNMSTYIKVDEKGTTAASLTETVISKSVGNETIVKVNKPYISLVYDMNLKRTLFIIKDTGILNIKN